MKAIDYNKLGGRKMVLAIWLSTWGGLLAAFSKFTQEVGILFAVIYAGFSYANQKITTASLAKENPE